MLYIEKENKKFLWDSTRQMWIEASENINDVDNDNKITNMSDIFVDFEDVHIEGDKNNRYKFKHNTTISSFQYTVVESKTDTLGGKYPFIRRNGDTCYRQFPITGMITHFNENDYPDEYMAENIKKTASNADGGVPLEDYFNKRIKERVSNNDKDLKTKYDNYYYKDSYLNGYTDYLLEREYRDDVIDYLYKNRVRLFRSPTEGNILVKLMNITLTPNEQINRRVYSMQCTAFEVDAFSIDNCIKYGIWDNEQDIMETKEKSTKTVYKVGQLQYDEPKSIDAQKIVIETNFYNDIEKDLQKRVERFISLDKVVELKANYYSNASYFGKTSNLNSNSQVTLLAPMSSELVSGINVEDATNNNFYEGRFYDPDVWSLPFSSNVTEALGFTNSKLRRWSELAYIFVRTILGEEADLDNFSLWSESKKNLLKENIKNIINNYNHNNLSFFLDIDNNFLYQNNTTNNRKELKKQFGLLISYILLYCITKGKELVTLFATYDISDPFLSFIKQYCPELKSNIDRVGGPPTDYANKILNVCINKKDYEKPFTGYKNAATELTINEQNLCCIEFFFGLALTIALDCNVGFGRRATSDDYISIGEQSQDEKGYIIDLATKDTGITNLQSTPILLAGHYMTVNGNAIIVPPQVSYELIDDGTEITSLSNYRLKDEPLKCLIDYVAQCTVFSSDYSSRVRQGSYQYYRVGQIRVNSSDEIIEKIKNKYNKTISQTKGNSEITVLGVPYVSIEAEPYTMALVRDSSDEKAYLHIINDTGILTLYDTGTFIESIAIYPRKNMASINENPQLAEAIGGTVESLNETLETFLGQENIIVDRNEIVYSDNHIFSDTLINYICLIRETRYL